MATVNVYWVRFVGIRRCEVGIVGGRTEKVTGWRDAIWRNWVEMNA